jgi:serine/threonine-protein kinase
MTTEFVEGTTLAELCRGGALSPAQAVRAICGVLSALEEGHALGIVHRGITAEHVVITPDGTVKLGGFGLAKPASDVNLTQAGAALGDAAYMAPEQVLGVGPLDGRADLYSAGILLFQALTGRVPFQGKNDFDTMVAQVNAPPPRPSELNPGITPELERMVLIALSKKPEDRFAGAGEFRQALAALNGAIRVLPPAVQGSAPPETAAPQSQGKAQGGGHWRLMVAIVVACLAVALLALWVKMH